MAEETAQSNQPPRNKDEVALELMKFITITTGYGKGMPGTGFATGKTPRSPEEYAELLIQLFERCRKVVNGQDRPE